MNFKDWTKEEIKQSEKGSFNDLQPISICTRGFKYPLVSTMEG